MAQSIFETPIGPLFISATDKGVRVLSFVEGYRHDEHMESLARDPYAERPRMQEREALAVIEAAQKQLGEYFEGARREFDIPLDLKGTPFQQRVWRAIAAIPFGETASYSEVAMSAGAPNAYRAAGTACGANPVVILVPCHRVVGTDRGLHGFGGGLDTKVWLLRHEGSAGRLKTDAWANAKALRRQPQLAW
jgi:O-6-methylguanine DNA methyltransferase